MLTAQAATRAPAAVRPALRVASELLDVLERVWAGIRRRHRDLPDAVIIIGPGDNNRRRIWGHFAPDRWARDRATDPKVERVHEVLLAGESLDRAPAETIGTMLHEAAHALAEVRGIKDTSRKGRYHNTRYKKLAESVGLDVAKHDRIGWSLTTMRPATLVDYAAEVEELRAVQEATRRARRMWAEEEEKTKRKRLRWACKCKPARMISQSKKDSERAATICSACESTYEAEEAGEDD